MLYSVISYRTYFSLTYYEVYNGNGPDLFYWSIFIQFDRIMKHRLLGSISM